MKDILIKSYNRDAVNYERKFKELQKEKYKLLFTPKKENNKKIINTPEKLIDFGCGTAMFFNYLKEIKSNITYYGVDIAKEMVEIASLKSQNIIISDIISTPYQDNYFDKAVSFTVLRVIEDDEIRILKEINRVLKPKALFYLSILKNRVDETLHRNLINTGFRILEEKNCGQDIGFICIKEEINNG